MTSREFAVLKHQGQKRRFTDIPYDIHPDTVTNIVRRYTNDPDMIDASQLHDTVEDTKTTYEEIIRKFNARVAALVEELTSDTLEIKKMGKGPYLLRKMMNMSPEALLIKLADRCDNTDISPITEEYREREPKFYYFVQRYREETAFILNGLARPLTSAHKELIKIIWNNIGLSPNVK